MENKTMAQKKFHIDAKGEIALCRKNMQRCPADMHWAEAEHARIHLSNLDFIAERDAKIAAFMPIKTNTSHPQHFRAWFSTENSSDSIRKFRENIDHYVAEHGEIPSYLEGTMRYTLGHSRWRQEIYFHIDVSPEIDLEDGYINRRWKIRVVEFDDNQLVFRNKHKTLHEVELIFDDHKEFEANIVKLRKAYVIALKATGKHYLEDYSEFTEPMVKKFWEMFDAIESVVQGEWDLWYNLGRGYFTKSTDDQIIVDVNYDRSAFSGQSFTNFAGKDQSYADRLMDAEIRLNDEIEGHPRASWSLYRKDRIWSVATRTFEGLHQDNLTPTSEDVRSHVYWHVIREVNPDKQEIALKKAQVAADLFTAVENELAKYTNPSGA
jgi:hypothetical protein